MYTSGRVAGLLVACLAAAPAGAQCTEVVNTSLLAGYRASRAVAVDQAQDLSRTAWSYHSGSPTGTLLWGVLVGTPLAWGSPGQAYSIPLAGPIFSNIPANNETPFFDRAPSFEGVMLHPGNDTGRDMVVVLAPQNPVTISGLSLDGEILGDVSDGMSWSVEARINGSQVSVIPTTTLFYSPVVSHTTMNPLGGTLPMTLQPGDVLWVRTSIGSAPFEDWGNTNLHLALSGGPVLMGSPNDAAICASKQASLTASVVGSGPLTYVWQYRESAGSWTTFGDGPLNLPLAGLVATITDSDKATVHLDILGDPDMTAVEFRCVVSNTCRSVTSGTAQLRSCIADRNCDGVVDLQDFFEWFSCWDLTQPCADIDGNDEIDLGDYFAFFAHFDASC